MIITKLGGHLIKKSFAVTIGILIFMFAFSLGAGAAPVLEKVSAYLNWSLNFEVDGQEWTPQEDNGDKLAPITYNNRTYLPVRAVSEAVGTAVDYDSQTKTVILGEKNARVSITSEEIDLGYSSMITEDKQYTVQDGTDYYSGIVLEDLNSAEKDFTLMPKGKYQQLELSFFSLDSDEEIRVRVFDGDTALKDVTLTPTTSSKTVNINIGSAKEIKIGAESSPGESEAIFVTGSYQ